MNWIGGRLRRHSKLPGDKQSFRTQSYHTRSNHQRRKIAQRSSASQDVNCNSAAKHSYPPPRSDESKFNFKPTTQNSVADNLSSHYHRSSQSERPKAAAIVTLHTASCPSPEATAFENIKSNLLRQSDWLGISAKKPLSMEFTPVKEREKVGRQRPLRISQVPKEDLAPVNSVGLKRTFSMMESIGDDTVARGPRFTRDVTNASPSRSVHTFIPHDHHINAPVACRQTFSPISPHCFANNADTYSSCAKYRHVASGICNAELPSLDTLRNVNSFDKIRQLKDSRSNPRCEAWLEQVSVKEFEHPQAEPRHFVPFTRVKSETSFIDNDQPKNFPSTPEPAIVNPHLLTTSANYDIAAGTSPGTPFKGFSESFFPVHTHGYRPLTRQPTSPLQQPSSVRDRLLDSPPASVRTYFHWDQAASESSLPRHAMMRPRLLKRLWSDAFLSTPTSNRHAGSPKTLSMPAQDPPRLHQIHANVLDLETPNLQQQSRLQTHPFNQRIECEAFGDRISSPESTLPQPHVNEFRSYDALRSLKKRLHSGEVSAVEISRRFDVPSLTSCTEVPSPPPDLDAAITGKSSDVAMGQNPALVLYNRSVWSRQGSSFAMW